MTLDELDEQLHAKTPEAAQLWATFAQGAQIYSTPLFSLKKTDAGDELNLAGSGTFVRQGDSYFILTAGHVWHEMLKKADFVGVTLREIHDHTCFIETKAIVPRGADRPASWNEWGPDIISLEIPPVKVGEIKAFRGFYEMDAGLKAMIKVDRNETYLLVGTPKVLGSYTQTHASVQLLGMWVGNPKNFTENNWDYFDAKAALHPSTPAESFGGVSGGGLWRVQIYLHPETGQIESTETLEGVAFYELGTSQGAGVIRCHGTESIRKVLESR